MESKKQYTQRQYLKYLFKYILKIYLARKNEKIPYLPPKKEYILRKQILKKFLGGTNLEASTHS